MLKRFFTAILFLLVGVTSFAATQKKNILVVCPYSLSGTWADKNLQPISELDKEKVNVSFSIMRNSSFKNVEEMNEREKELFRNFGGERPDLIVLFGPGNYILAEDFNKKWKDVPMVLIGELSYVCDKEYVCDSVIREDARRTPIKSFARDKNITFVHTPVFPRESVDLMLKVTPYMQTLVFLGGEEFVSREIENNLALVARDIEREFKPLHPDDISFRDLANMASNINRKKMGFIYCNWHDKAGKKDPTLPAAGLREAMEKIVPLFNTYHCTLNDGFHPVGFVSYDVEIMVKEIKDVISHIIFDRKAAKDIPFVTIPQEKPVLDYAVLERMGINPNAIKGDIHFVHTPQTLWDKYKVKMLFLAALGLGLLSLFFYRLYKRQHNLVNTVLRTQEELRKAKEKAEQSDQMKTAFVQNVSHEIRTPLNAVVGFSQLLAMPDDVITPEEKEKFVGYVQNNSEMLIMLVNDILAVSDIERGAFIINIGDVCCNAVCQNALRSVETRVPAKVRMYYTSEVSDTFMLRSDGQRIQQILINFLTNACKHTDSGEIHVHCSLKENQGKVTFSVADTGTGVPKEMAEKIFERFTKLNAFKQGVGLGLNICRNVAAKLNGEVKLDTSYTGGARFLCILPIDNNK